MVNPDLRFESKWFWAVLVLSILLVAWAVSGIA